MKSNDLQNKNASELKQMLPDLRSKLAKLSFELEANTLKDSSQVGKVKKDIARILTLLKSQNSQILNSKF